METVPEALYGTWEDLGNTGVYYEFPETIKDSCYVMALAYSGLKLINKLWCEISPRQMNIDTRGLSDYVIHGDTLLMTDSRNITTKCLRVEKGKVDHTNWMKPVTVLASKPVPSAWIPAHGFGVDGDTIYYKNNPGRIIKYNPLTREYYDSINYWGVSSIWVHKPFMYYLNGGEISMSEGFSSKTTNPGFTGMVGKGIDFMSIDRTTGIFYTIGRLEMYSAQEGGEMKQMSLSQSLLVQAEWTFAYGNGEFISIVSGLQQNTFARVKYNASKGFEVVENYGPIPGYDYVSNFGTDGDVIWIAANNILTGKDELLKIGLD